MRQHPTALSFHDLEACDLQVIDKAMLNKIFTTLVSVLFTVVPIILSLHERPNTESALGGGAAQCKLSAFHRGVVRSVLAEHNATQCSFANMTLGGILGD